jgi:hypothetical protein
MALRYGYTNLNFREAIHKDITSERKGWGISELFIELGQYYRQVKRYYEVFGKEKVMVILFDDLKNDLNQTLSSIFSFLEIDSLHHKKIGSPEFCQSAKI